MVRGMNILNYKSYLKAMHRLMGSVLNVEDQRRCEKILHYLRIYHDLVTGFSSLNKSTAPKTIEILRKIQRFAKEAEFEKEHMQKISEIAQSTIEGLKHVNFSDIDEIGNPGHAKTKMLMAQNICVLRILKLSS
jgi:mevalonate kinase